MRQVLIHCVGFCLALSLVTKPSIVDASPVTFSGTGSSSGTGEVSGRQFTWTANPGLVNPPGQPGGSILAWGVIGNPNSTGFDFDLTMAFPASWEFQAIEFGALNEISNEFSVQLFDTNSDPIDSSTLTANSTGGFGFQPWNYDALTKRWQYSVVTGSNNGHQASLSGSITGVRTLLVDVDDHLGIDQIINLQLGVTCSPGDTDGDGDIDTADLTTAITNFTGAGGSGKTCEDGDTDDDGDVDTADLTFSITNFTGAQAGNAGVPDLIYDPATGNVTIDADGADVISFSLQGGPFNAADFSELPAGLTDNIASQIGWTSFNLFSGLTGSANLGAILPAGLDLAALEAALTTASYGLALSGGGGGGRLDIVIPEPASMVLMGLGALALMRRRRAAYRRHRAKTLDETIDAPAKQFPGRSLLD